MIANDVNFGGKKTLQEEFIRLYGTEALDQLDKSVIHVFRISSNQYMPVEGFEGVWLLETRDGDTGDLIVDFNFSNRQVYTDDDELKEFLYGLTEQVQEEAVAYNYE